MKHTWMSDPGQPSRGIILMRLHPGDELHACLREVARREGLPSAAVSGVGAVNDIVLALFDPATKRYLETHLAEDLEVVSLGGNLAWVGEEPLAHLHGVVSRADCSTLAGHVVRATVSITLELTLIVGNRRIARRPDAHFGLNLLDLD
jgi:predicted DNA-binding protein with PD1-like motif